jgi:hypothetical protein
MKTYSLSLIFVSFITIFSFTGCGSDGESSNNLDSFQELNETEMLNDIGADASGNIDTEDASYSKFYGEWVEATDVSGERIYLTTQDDLNDYQPLEGVDDVIQKGENFYIRVSEQNISFSGKIDLSNYRDTKFGFEEIGNIEVILKNIQDENIRATAKINEDHSFSGDGLPSGEYNVIGTANGSESFSTEMEITSKSEDLGSFKFVQSGNANLKAKIKREKIDGKISPYYAGESYSIDIEVENIGDRDVEVLFSEIENPIFSMTDKSNKLIRVNETQTIQLDASFSNSQIENVQIYSFDLTLKNANNEDEIWRETFNLKVYKSYSEINVSVEGGNNFSFIVRGDDGFIGSAYKNSKSFKIPLTDSNSDYKLVVFNTINDNQGLYFYINQTNNSSCETVSSISKQVFNIGYEECKKQKVFPNRAKVWSIKTPELNTSAEELNNKPPVAKLSYKKDNNDSYMFDFSGSSDDVGIVKYTLIRESEINETLYSGLDKNFSLEKGEFDVGSNDFYLQVEDKFGLIASSELVLIPVDNDRPNAKFEVTNFSKDGFSLGDEIELNASKSYDTDSEIESYIFESSIDGNLSCDSTSPICSINNLSEGTHTITLTVKDSYGAVDEAEVNIKVNGNQPPKAVIKTDESAYNTYQDVKIDASDSSDSDGEIISYSFYLDGDRLENCSESVCIVSAEYFDVISDDIFEFFLKTDHEILLSIKDDEGLEANTTHSITRYFDIMADIPAEEPVSTESAIPISTSSSTERYLDSESSEIFQIELLSQKSLVIQTSSSIDTKGSILDSFGNEIAYDDDGGENNNFKIERELEAGTYYIKVEGYNSDISGDYSISVSEIGETHVSTPTDVSNDNITTLVSNHDFLGMGYRFLGYGIEVSTTGEFEDDYEDKHLLTVTTNSTSVPNESSNIYYVQDNLITELFLVKNLGDSFSFQYNFDLENSEFISFKYSTLDYSYGDKFTILFGDKEVEIVVGQYYENNEILLNESEPPPSFPSIMKFY